MTDTLNNLYEELIFLDEIAGQLDDDGNRRTEIRRKELRKEIEEVQKLVSRWG